MKTSARARLAQARIALTPVKVWPKHWPETASLDHRIALLCATRGAV